VIDGTLVRMMWHDNEWGFSDRDCDGQADLTRLQ
jgi:glyceraldehyde-3-phosphate dehydrogenase/erythrose-4-phosphate dehydrogenase